MTWRFRTFAASIVAALLLSCSAAICQQPNPSPKAVATISSTLDSQLLLREKAIVDSAEAMPADRYAFAPNGEAFSGSRTFALEVRHLATMNFVFYSAILGQAPPAGVSFAGTMNGPDNLQSKEQIVQFLKDSFALGHRAIATINERNALALMDDSNFTFLQPYALNSRLGLANLACAHAVDHYGQIVVYLRMNGITPPASVGQPPANPH